MTEVEKFRAVYEENGIYDRLLLRHFFGGVEDSELVADRLRADFGAPAETFNILELGCGTGRVTSQLAPYANRLLLADYSPVMIDAARARFPRAEVMRADTRSAVATLIDDGGAATFDVVGAFWSLSYPLGEFFETLTVDGVQPMTDLKSRERTLTFVRQLVDLLAPGGHLIALFFDADTPEQRLVTRLWERVAPFPEHGRRYTLDLLLEGLRLAEDTGGGSLLHTRIGGTAWAQDREAAARWFSSVHLKSFPGLVLDPDVQTEISSFIDRYERPTGEVALPSGVNLIDFRAGEPARR